MKIEAKGIAVGLGLAIATLLLIGLATRGFSGDQEGSMETAADNANVAVQGTNEEGASTAAPIVAVQEKEDDASGEKTTPSQAEEAVVPDNGQESDPDDGKSTLTRLTGFFNTLVVGRDAIDTIKSIPDAVLKIIEDDDEEEEEGDEDGDEREQSKKKKGNKDKDRKRRGKREARSQEQPEEVVVRVPEYKSTWFDALLGIFGPRDKSTSTARDPFSAGKRRRRRDPTWQDISIGDGQEDEPE